MGGLATALALWGWAASAAAQTSPALEQAVTSARLEAVQLVYASTAVPLSVATLRPMAQANHVLAQWLLADALAQQHQDREAAHWLYSASLGTRMDAALCRMRDAKTMEFRLLQSSTARFDALRRNEALRRDALSSAIAFHRTRLARSAEPGWVCRLVAAESRRPLKQPLEPVETWQARRAAVLVEYQKQTGLDFSRSPDLFRITPLHR